MRRYSRSIITDARELFGKVYDWLYIKMTQLKIPIRYDIESEIDKCKLM